MPTPPPPPELSPELHRALGAGLYNRCWDLMEVEDRTQDQDDELIATAHASAWHWRQVGHTANQSRAHWMCSRVYAVLGRSEPAIYHARRCVEIVEAGGEGIEDWDAPGAYEAMARALAVGGDLDGAAEWKARAAAGAAAIAEVRRPDRDRGRSRHAPRLRSIPGSPGWFVMRRWAHERLEAGRPPLEPGHGLAVLPRRGPQGRSAGLQPPLGVGPPVRHLRRSLPAHLRGLVEPGGVRDGDGADPPRPPRRRQHVPQPGPRGQARLDARPHLRRARDPRARRRLDGARAHGPRHRVRHGLRAAARLARRGGGAPAGTCSTASRSPRRPAGTTSSTTCATRRRRCRPTCRS